MSYKLNSNDFKARSNTLPPLLVNNSHYSSAGSGVVVVVCAARSSSCPHRQIDVISLSLPFLFFVFFFPLLNFLYPSISFSSS